MTLHDHERIQQRLTSVADPVGFLVSLFTHAPVGFAVWTADGKALLTNKAFMELFLVEPPPEYNVLKDELLAANGMLPLFQRAFRGETVNVPTFWYDPREHISISVKEGRRVAISMTIFPLFKASGEVDYVAATYKDETESMLANERLRVSEERQRLAEQASRVGAFEWNVQTGVNTWTPALEALYGLEPGEFGATQKSWEQLIHPADRAEAVARVNRALETFLPVEGEWRVAWRDGSVHWLVGRFQVLNDEAGKPHRLIGVNMDITERKREEEARRRAEARFRRLADAGILGIVTTDIHGNILEANGAFLRMVGYTSEEVLSGKVRWPEMTPPEWRHLDEQAIEQLKATGAAVPWEKEYIRKDGSRVPILVGVAMLDSATGECIAFILDVSERKRAEAAVRVSEAQKAAVMEAALDAIVLMDHEGMITEFNPAAEKTFGYSRQEVIGTPLAEVLVPASLRDRHRAGLERYRNTGEGPIVGKRIEVPAQRKGGAEFPAEVAVVRIRSEGPAVFTGYIRDITERRQAAEAELLRRAKEAAEEANTELEAFSYSVAHDLRAPLRAINGFSTALIDDLGGKLESEAKDYLERIGAGARRMGELIDTLLELARLTRTAPRREPVNLTELAKNVVARLRAADPKRMVEVVVTDGLEVEGDPQLLRILLENLLGNAWKFTSKRRAARIEFGREHVDGTIAYYVRDNGAGFEMEHVGKLFAPFRRLHAAAEFEGTGIGLATVQRIVRRHGGRVWAEGAEDQGATFRFTLSLGSQQAGGRLWMPTK
jgi:PAS domain S-box-containing protein